MTMYRVEVVVECGLDPGCHDVELHLAGVRLAGDEPAVQIFCIASFSKMKDAEAYADRVRVALSTLP